jgi:(p)ppGpp synthase/HD superfamily hydrolase
VSDQTPPGTVEATRLDDAFAYAVAAHKGQLRKGTEIPYHSHLLGVCSLVLEDGGNEEEAIAALLHDAAEDQGGRARLEDIRARFGDRVAEIVEACTDSFEEKKPLYRERKEPFIERLRAETDKGILRVELADKLHNARAILRDYRQLGNAVWARFNPTPDDIEWYYRSLVDAFREVSTSPMVEELGRAVSDLLQLRRSAPAGMGPS